MSSPERLCTATTTGGTIPAVTRATPVVDGLGAGPIPKVRNGVRLLAVAALAGASVLTTAGPAAAATGVSKSGSTLTATARAGVANNITVSASGADFVVTDSADTVSAGAGCRAVAGNTHQVRCASAGITAIAVNGGDLNDRLTGNVGVTPTSTSTTLNGGAGNDVLAAGPSGQLLVLNGGDGNDALRGGAGGDFLDGGAGADSMRGAGGHDIASYNGRVAAVTVTLDNLANDGAANERDNVATDVEDVFGGRGNDVITGSSANNGLTGGPGNDTLRGGAGNDELLGGDGNDSLSGDAGNDLARADVELFLGADGADTFAGGAGVDRMSYQGRFVEGVRVSLDNVANDGRTNERDNIRSDVENVDGGGGGDVITGSGLNNTLRGNGGNDRLSGGAANDSLSGGAGNDSVTGGAGNDSINGDAGNDTLLGVDGVVRNDTLRGGANTDTCTADVGDTKTECER
jgi:Ca2+-binding RTX toxin-like protein